MTTQRTYEVRPLGDVPRVRGVLEMQREISVAPDENHLFAAFVRNFGALSGATHAMDLDRRGLPPGRYRVMMRERLDSEFITAEGIAAVNNWDMPFGDLPTHETPVLSRLVVGDEPLFIDRVDPGDDPVLDGWLDGPRAAYSIPIFEDGVASEYAILFLDPDLEFDPARLPLDVANINLLSRSIVLLKAHNQVRTLHRRVTAQISELGRVQRSLLPDMPPDDPRISVAVSYQPSDAAGGDYYDYRQFEGGVHGIVIADVSGHGPVASVAMAIMRTALHAFRMFDRPPESTVPDLNALLMQSLEPGMFVTAFFLTIEPVSGRATYACCGHNPPRLRRASGEIAAVDGSAGPPLGLLADLVPQGAVFRLEPGDLVVLYTDGITEAFSPEGELFGTERLDRAVRAGAGDPDDTVAAVLEAVAAHQGHRSRADDQTLVVIRYNGPSAGASA
jgi:sigma-B regulation protein RsbU (phosphoserine phosphatase)